MRPLFESGVSVIFWLSGAAFIRGRRLIEGGVYSRASFINILAFRCGVYLWAAFNRGRRLFEGGAHYYFGSQVRRYSRWAFNRGWRLLLFWLSGVAFIRGRRLFEEIQYTISPEVH